MKAVPQAKSLFFARILQVINLSLTILLLACKMNGRNYPPACIYARVLLTSSPYDQARSGLVNECNFLNEQTFTKHRQSLSPDLHYF